MQAEGWYRDPYGIHDDRWFSVGRPTFLVRDQGVESHDEPPTGEPSLPLVPSAEVAVSDGDDLVRVDEPRHEWVNPMDASGGLGIGFA
jgi:hypothetical protein